jgi:AraC family transcriptional activator FtrA
MKNIAVLNYNNASLFELACAVELFAIPRPEFADWYSTDVISFEAGQQNSSGNILIQNKVIEHLDDYETLIIPSWPTHITKVKGNLAEQVSKFHREKKRIITFCSGAFLLGSLGILDSRDATTHWRYAQRFKDRFKDTHYVDNVLYVYDGRIGCSAGSASALDLCLAVIRDDYGHAIANQVARRLVISAHRKGGQAQFVETPILKAPQHFTQALDWVMQNLHKSFTIDHLANMASMSRRTFDRKLNDSFGMTPKHWLTQQRLERAKELLSGRQGDIEFIAGQSGFDNATTMRHHFKKHLGLSPRQYRDQFSNKQAS